jgi:hypothetical protein
MQKVVTALEKNVEWIAMGLAGIWVLWVVWTFVISKPVAAEVGDRQLSASVADREIAEEARKLEAKITEKGAAPAIVVPQVAMDWTVPVPAPLPAPPIESPIVRLRNVEEQFERDPRNPNAAPIRVTGDKVAQLPEIPQPRIVEVVADKGQIIPPVIQPNMMNPNGGGAGGEFAAQPLLPPQPLQPDAIDNRGGGPNALPVNAKDAWWVWVTAKFNEGAVQQAYQAAKIPPHLNRMEYLAVEVQREELLPNGQWGNAKLIPPLKHNAPPPDFDRQAAPMNYLSWALQQGNQYVILEPPFYQTVGPRKIPLHLQPKVQMAADQMIPQFRDMKELAAQLEGMLPTARAQLENSLDLTPQQKQELYQARQDIARDKQRLEAQQRQQQRQQQDQQRRSNRPTGRNFAPIDPELMGEMLASGGSNNLPGRGWNPRGSDYSRGSANMPLPMVNPVNPQDPTQMNVTRPGGFINQQGQVTFGEFDVWAYDDTVEPGKTYRYRLRVVLKNPVFKINAAVADPKLAQVMELPANKDAAWTEWSKPVVVERNVEMFLAGSNRDSVRFDIYRWQEGRVNKQVYTATPGDVVGSVDSKSKMDFSTGYSVVDIRQLGNRDWRVTMIDPNGAQVVRTLQDDLNNPKKNALEAEASKPANPALTDLR